MAVLAHPDDESLGCGGTLARYSAEGVDTFLVTATRGESGRFRGHRRDSERHPGADALARIREKELRAAASTLGIRELAVLDYRDQELDRAAPAEAIAKIAECIRRMRPQVVVTFPPDGAYGHPDHIAISQFTTAATVAAAVPHPADATPGHRVSKLYYIAWPRSGWDAYEQAFGRVKTVVDGGERPAVAWPEWAISAQIDARGVWETVWRAVRCHESQTGAYEALHRLAPEDHERLWGQQYFYRAFSFVNGGRRVETDLFEGLRT